MEEESRNYITSLLVSCRDIIVNRDIDNLDYGILLIDHAIYHLCLPQNVETIPWLDTALEMLENVLHEFEDILGTCRQRSVGKPKLEIPTNSLHELLSLKFTVGAIANIYGVSSRTVHRRLKDANISVKQTYSHVSDEQLEEMIAMILLEHPNTGYKRMLGFLSARGHRVQEYHVRNAMRNVDPLGVQSRTNENRTINRRVYFVRYAMERWHLDSNMKLVRYKMIIRSCIDGNSRCCIYINIGSDNKCSSNMKAFMEGVRNFGVPRGIRCDKGNENRSIARFMMTVRGDESGQVLTGKSVHNQRIERFWGDLYRDTGFYYNIFRSMEERGILDVENPAHLFVLHHVFLKRIQNCFNEFQEGWNHHKVSTENNRTPLQLMICNRPPENHKCVVARETLEEVYRYCMGLQVTQDGEFHHIRNPSPVGYECTDEQMRLLNEVNVLECSDTHGVDIYLHCLQLLHLDEN